MIKIIKYIALLCLALASVNLYAYNIPNPLNGLVLVYSRHSGNVTPCVSMTNPASYTTFCFPAGHLVLFNNNGSYSPNVTIPQPNTLLVQWDYPGPTGSVTIYCGNGGWQAGGNNTIYLCRQPKK